MEVLDRILNQPYLELKAPDFALNFIWILNVDLIKNSVTMALLNISIDKIYILSYKFKTYVEQHLPLNNVKIIQ